jgi:ketosteroid isomerase-like protein
LISAGLRAESNGGVEEHGRKTQEDVTETLIRKRVEDLAKAIGAKDIDRVMALYARDLVSFDLTPPLRRYGTDEKRRAWQEVFAASSGPIAYEVRDLTVTTNGEVAFVHSLNHINSTLPSGPVDMWLRWTACFRQIDGVWLVVHDHVSVPADPAHGRAVLNLTP